MGWLARLSFGKGGTALAEAELEDADSRPQTTSGPQLMVLVNDASGRASFKTHVFDDAESAIEWVRYWFPMDAEIGMTAFWAMTDRPESGPDSAAEPLVMIRDTSRDGVVYLFSFADIDSAQAFIRDEVERGTKPDAMLFYWAVQVKREIDRWGKLTLTPSTPPGVAAFEPEAEAAESDSWIVREAPVAERAPAKPAGNARALMEEAPNARTGVTEVNDPGNETFELTSWIERARKSPSRQRDVVEIAAEVVAASEESFKTPAVEAEPEVFFEERVVPDAALEEAEAEAAAEAAPEALDVEPEPVVATVEAVEETQAEVVTGTAAFVDAPEATEPEAEVEKGVFTDAPEQPELEEDTEVAAVDAASEDAEDQTPIEGVSAAKRSDVDDGALRVRASTNGNGHKPPLAHEVVVEINGHKSNHAAAESTDSGSAMPDDPRPAAPEETLPSMNGYATANGHAAQVTSSHGEGTPAIERLEDNSDAEADDTLDQAPETVREVRVDAASNGRDETISIQIAIHLQSRALRMKRWEVKDEPFEGFKSPPGRF